MSKVHAVTNLSNSASTTITAIRSAVNEWETDKSSPAEASKAIEAITLSCATMTKEVMAILGSNQVSSKKQGCSAVSKSDDEQKYESNPGKDTKVDSSDKTKDEPKSRVVQRLDACGLNGLDFCRTLERVCGGVLTGPFALECLLDENFKTSPVINIVVQDSWRTYLVAWLTDSGYEMTVSFSHDMRSQKSTWTNKNEKLPLISVVSVIKEDVDQFVLDTADISCDQVRFDGCEFKYPPEVVRKVGLVLRRDAKNLAEIIKAYELFGFVIIDNKALVDANNSLQLKLDALTSRFAGVVRTLCEEMSESIQDNDQISKIALQNVNRNTKAAAILSKIVPIAK